MLDFINIQKFQDKVEDLIDFYMDKNQQCKPSDVVNYVNEALLSCFVETYNYPSGSRIVCRAVYRDDLIVFELMYWGNLN